MIGISFKYKDFSISNDRRMSAFRYSVVTEDSVYEFKETLKWPEALKEGKAIDSLHISLHIALGMSYYKTFIPPEIELPYELTQSDADFWNKVFTEGLGEFLYKNDLDSSIVANFKATPGSTASTDTNLTLRATTMLGIGGGKDSIVAGELLKEIKTKVKGFVLATKSNTGVTKDVAETMGIDLLVVERTIDPQIKYVNDLPQSYNGHIPVSAIIALVGAMVAVNNESSYIAVGNESSASIPQITWRGDAINHQWSKSFEFEKMFQKYLHETVSEDVHYFSAIRPLSSVAVARIFAMYPKYFNIFTSDNSQFKIDNENSELRWTKDSSKMLSSFILLSPWMKEEDLISAFGLNPLDNESQEEMFVSLLGKSDKPVLDCVGTPEELIASLAQLTSYGKFTDTYLVKLAIERGYLEGAKSLNELCELTPHVIPGHLSDALIYLMDDKL
jgi:hypothetical protein